MDTMYSLPHDVQPPPERTLEYALVADVERRFGVDAGAVYRWERDADVSAARQAAMWALAQLGHSPAAIGRILGRDHSTILHGLARAAEEPEWQRAVGPAIELTGAAGPSQALLRWLEHGLADEATTHVAAIHAYAVCTLLGLERRPAVLCIAGLQLVATRWRHRAALEEGLRRIGLGAHIGRINGHTRIVRSER